MAESEVVVWKHIGLRGHSVGTFRCEPDRIVWKSAIVNEDDRAYSRVIPRSALRTESGGGGALWTVIGRSGHLRIQTKDGGNTKQQQQQQQHNQLKHELRFDGFPSNDYELLQKILKEKYGVNLQMHMLSSAGTQYGLTSVVGKNLVFRHCVLDEMNEEGQEFEPRAEDEMMSLDLAEVSQCVLPGNNRNEIELQFPESDAVEAGTDQLVAIRMYGA